MRLIDADALIEAINKSTCHFPEVLWKQVVRDVIENQPTAYDVEKVVEQLENLKNFGLYKVRNNLVMVIRKKDLKEFTDLCFGEAIEIVRKGGAV